jgi:uncharacterized membrane protein YqiK
VAELDVDILVDEGIDTPTVAAEQFDQMLKMAGTGMVQIPPDVLIEASSLKNKDRLLEMMKQPPSEEQQIMQKLQLAGTQAQVEKTQSETAKNMAQAQAADPSAQMELEHAKAEHSAGMAEQKQQHGMAMAERKQQFGEALAVHNANKPQAKAA